LSRPRLLPQDQDQDSGSQDQTKTLFFVLEAPRDQDFGLKDYITGQSMGIWLVLVSDVNKTKF